MKIAVLADIHANYQALLAAIAHVETWSPDYVVIAGDVVNRGPRPAECLNLLLEKSTNGNWLFVQGNHEDYVISHSLPETPLTGPIAEVHRPSYWTYLRLNKDVSELKAMPIQQSLYDPDGYELRFVHGSMLGKRDGIYPETSTQSLREKIGLDSHEQNSSALSNMKVFCVGHTHRSLVRELDGVLVINAGSAGLPFDRDRRLAYAQLSWHKGQWNAEIVRLEYDFHQAERDFLITGYLEEGGPIIKLVQIELLTARSMLYNWAVKYQDMAIREEISVEKSVEEFISQTWDSE